MEAFPVNEFFLVRFYHPDFGPRTGLRIGDTVFDISSRFETVTSWLQASVGRVDTAIADVEAAAEASTRSFPAHLFERQPTADEPHWLPPVDGQEVWAAGVTYERSRAARQEEAIDSGDIYARVYVANRPELFFKASGPRVVGPWGEVGIRSDAHWNVPEPELGLVINPALEIVGITAGNDVSSRDIEGDNPLYLPQAKMYTASCSLGPGILLGKVGESWPAVGIGLRIDRGGREVFNGQTHTENIKRRPDELVEFLGRCYAMPDGAVLLTGTGIVPPDDFTLQAGDKITITVETVGVLENSVKVV
jgi:2-dehydro-3-deoxy-D-arabinonate dehydratase